MNKVALAMALALVAFALLATPVLAESPKKIPVTALQKPYLWVFLQGVSKDFDTNGGISQNRDYVGTGSIKLNLPSELGGTITGTVSSDDVDYTPIQKNLFAIWHWELKWTFLEGTFEGINTEKLSENGGWEGHTVLHGTGEYDGWVLVLNGQRTSGMNWEGTLLIP